MDRPSSDEAQPQTVNAVQIPPELIQKWQEVVDIVADIIRVPAALVVRAEPPDSVVLVASESAGNPFERGGKEPLNSGVYCETVMKTRQPLLIPNALADPAWSRSPDLKVGMISYMGFPIIWPSGEMFGTICVLDAKANTYSQLYERLMMQFRAVIEADLRLLCSFDAQMAKEARARLEESESARRVILATLEELQRAEEGLQASQQKLKEAVRLRDEFLSIASHELRTPVSSLQLMIQGLTRGLVPPSPENILRAFGLAERQVGRLTRLIEELLEVSRLQAEQLTLQLEQVDLAAVTREVVQRFEADLKRASCPVSLYAARPVIGCWDRSKLEQIITNILANAIKFGSGNSIELTVEEEPIGSGRMVVTDHGIGIAPESLPYIFERFRRAVCARAYGGLGLGLYIVRSLVEAMGGTVRAESVLGSGSTFTVELPCAQPPSGLPHPQSLTPSA